MDQDKGLLYHSPHKFKHGHIRYGLEHAKNIADFKAVSLNALHSSMEITDEFYSNLNDGEIQNRIGSLGKGNPPNKKEELLELLEEFLAWKNRRS